jgi:peptidoglycan/xylan/chitin deacetylase (PgdA/CDA1 family)
MWATPLVIVLGQAGGPVGSQASRSGTEAGRRVAITIDDLPTVSRNFTSAADHERLTTKLVGALVRHHVPAIGFVNEGKLYRGGTLDEREVDLLGQWTRARLELGNHTYSHVDLHAVDVDAYLDDIIRGDEVTRRVMAEVGRTPRFFRHPFLHTGRTLAVRARVDSLLAARGYRVAPVTFDNYDYLFAAAYDDALARRDSLEAKQVATKYVAYMDTVFGFYEAQSRTIVGREIPQVLLIHASFLNANTFDALAEMMERRGYAFASLEEVLRDSAYKSADSYVGPAGITWLHRWALTRGMRGTTFAGEPEVPPEIAAHAAR